MSSEEREQATQRALEVIISEKVFSRLKTQMLVVFLVSFALAVAVAWSLAWEYRTVSELSAARISEYQLLVAESLQELHVLDLEEVAKRTRPTKVCERSLSEEAAAGLLERELGRPPESGELRQLRERAEAFGVCDITEVERVLANGENRARVDTVYRLLLGRPADPIGRFIYGFWLANGIEIEAVGRDIMTSPEFHRLKKLSVES